MVTEWGLHFKFRVIEVQPAAVLQIKGCEHRGKIFLKEARGTITKEQQIYSNKMKSGLLSKRMSKGMLNLRRQYFVIWCATSLSRNPSPSVSLMMRWMMMTVGEGEKEGGRTRRIIPSEYTTNVFIRLKLTGGGGESCAETESVHVSDTVHYHQLSPAAALSLSILFLKRDGGSHAS